MSAEETRPILSDEYARREDPESDLAGGPVEEEYEIGWKNRNCLADICVYCLTGLILVLIILWASRFPGQGFGLFATSILLSMTIMGYLEYKQNIVDLSDAPLPQPVWGLSVTLFIGVMAKMVALALNLIVFLLLRCLGLDLGNPHAADSALSLPEDLLRVFIVSLIFIGLVEELVKLQFLLTYDDADGDSTFGKRLNIYHPMGVVLLSIGVSLGASGWNIMSSMYTPDHLLPWYFAYPFTIMETVLNASTGALVGVGVSRRMFYRETVTASNMLMVPILLRFGFFLVMMLPFRSRTLHAEEREAKHLFHHLHHFMYQRTHEIPAIDIGALYSVLVLINLVLVLVAAFVAKQEVDNLFTHRGPVQSGRKQTDEPIPDGL